MFFFQMNQNAAKVVLDVRISHRFDKIQYLKSYYNKNIFLYIAAKQGDGFLPGTAYTYDFEGLAKVQLSSADHQETSVKISAKAVITNLGNCAHLLKITTIDISTPDGTVSISQNHHTISSDQTEIHHLYNFRNTLNQEISTKQSGLFFKMAFLVQIFVLKMMTIKHQSISNELFYPCCKLPLNITLK